MLFTVWSESSDSISGFTTGDFPVYTHCEYTPLILEATMVQACLSYLAECPQLSSLHALGLNITLK